MFCPECKGKTRIYRTETIGGVTKRWRTCLSCLRKYVSHEEIDREVTPGAGRTRCTVCGANVETENIYNSKKRFRRRYLSCPNCGRKFSETQTGAGITTEERRVA